MDKADSALVVADAVREELLTSFLGEQLGAMVVAADADGLLVDPPPQSNAAARSS